MNARRHHIIQPEKPSSLRAGIKWDPLEKDHKDEFHGAESKKKTWTKLVVISLNIAWLWTVATLCKLTFILRGLGKQIDKKRAVKQNKRYELTLYLDQKESDSYDLDLCCFCYDKNGKLAGYVTPTVTEMHGKAAWHPAFIHSGDDDTGTGNGFDEDLVIKLPEVDESIHQIYVLMVSINHGFDEIKGGFWSIVSTRDEEEIMAVQLKTKDRHTLHIMARAIRQGNAWLVEELAEFDTLPDDDMPMQEQISRLIISNYFAA